MDDYASPLASPRYTYAYRPRSPPPQYDRRVHQRAWPPSPSVEDESTALGKEVRAGLQSAARDDEPPQHTRGTVDQEKIIEDIEPCADHRFVLVSDPSESSDPPVFTERVSTPYAFTRPQKETSDLLSPTRTLDLRDQDVFDDSDVEAEEASRLRASERRPARYSFVKSDLHHEDVRAHIYDPKPKPKPDAPTQPAAYPITTADVSRPSSRLGRHDSLPSPAPRADVLPYPVDDRPLGILMPDEELYQFDHTTASSPRQPFPESKRFPAAQGPAQTSSPIAERPVHVAEARPSSSHSRLGRERQRERTPAARSDVDRPLPSCPRSVPTSRYDDWYSLKGYRFFDICPSCYEGVFSSTPFAPSFSQTRRGEKPAERVCDFSSPWIRLAWLLTIKQRLASLEMLYALADIFETDRPCPDDRELSSDRVTWYGITDPRDGAHIANFAICSSDKKMIEALLPTMRGYFTALSNTYSSSPSGKFMCGLRTSSRRFPKYLDLLVELDLEAQDLGQKPNMSRFIQMVRDNAFKGECGRSKTFVRKAWHFIPSLPEFTVCEQCYEELIWPAMQSRTTPSAIPRLFNKTMQLAPEDPEVGTSCMLYSPRMRKVWDESVREEDFAYLKRKVLERKRVENRITKERKNIVNWMLSLDRGSLQWDRAKSELRELDREWAAWE